MSKMRAKMRVSNVISHTNPDGKITGEQLKFNAVCKEGGYPSDGSDENNSFAKWTPNAELNMSVNNPELFGQFEIGQAYYVDFTEAV